MTRWIALTGLAIAASVAALAIAVAHVFVHDREAAEQALAQDRLQSLTLAAHSLSADLAQIGDDLSLAGTLASDAESPDVAARELRAITRVKRAYLAFVARPATGAALEVPSPAAPPDVVARAAPVIAKLLDVAERAPGELHISRGLSDRDDAAAWYRVFARRASERDIAIAAIVDMRLLVTPPAALGGGSSRVLVLSAHGVPAPASDPELAARIRDAREPVLDGLIADARGRRPGTAILGADVASSLGLPDARAVAAAVPVPIDEGPPWILAVVSSTDSLDARHAALVRRMAIGGALGAALLMAATVYIVRNARRAALLRERLRHADMLARLTEKAIRAEKLATAGQLAAGIAHELGTPLNVARGRAEMVLAHLGRGHADARNLQIATEQIDHVARLIQQLLDHVRPNPQRIESVDLPRALSTVGELLSAHAAARGVELQVDTGDAPPKVRADRGQLQQVLVNLVMNALDACARGGHVTLRARRHAGLAAIEVADDGHGIAPEDRANVFDPFFTTKKRGRGTGLGLWIVAEVARAHTAEIEVDSALGAGTTVRLLWPDAEPAA